MKGITLSVLVVFLSACSQSASENGQALSELIMPASEHAKLSKLEVVLVIDDLADADRSVPETFVKLLKRFGVRGAANFTYTWGDPNGYLLIDGNIHRFSSAETAVNNLLGDQSRLDAVNAVKLEGIGDAAININDQSLSFVSGELKVTLTAIQKEIDLESVAHAYAGWLSGREGGAR